MAGLATRASHTSRLPRARVDAPRGRPRPSTEVRAGSPRKKPTRPRSTRVLPVCDAGVVRGGAHSTPCSAAHMGIEWLYQTRLIYSWTNAGALACSRGKGRPSTRPSAALVSIGRRSRNWLTLTTHILFFHVQLLQLLPSRQPPLLPHCASSLKATPPPKAPKIPRTSKFDQYTQLSPA